MPLGRPRPDQHNRILGLFQRRCEGMLAARYIVQRLRSGTKMLVAVGQIGLLADHADIELAGTPALADTGIDDRSFLARI